MRVTLRRLASVLAVLAIAGLAPATASAFTPPAVTLEGGLSSTDLQPDPYAETHRLLGGAGGVALDFQITDRISFEPGILWVRRGARLGESQVTDGIGNVIGSFTPYLTADYTDIPLLARFEPPSETDWKMFAIIGPRFGFKTGERLEARGSVPGTYDSSRFESTEVGVTAGGGVEYGSGVHRLVMDLRYDAGLTNHSDGSGTKFRTDVVMLMVGYVFHPAE